LDGAEAVLVYWVPPQGIIDAPIKQLVAFKKVHIKAGKKTKLDFKFNTMADYWVWLITDLTYFWLHSPSPSISSAIQKENFHRK
jgi:hypothetical protein